MGKIDDEGYLHLTGRLKDLIIRGGENISPLEIEDVISKMDEVQAVRVIGVKDELYGEQVCACVVPVAGKEVDPKVVKANVAGKLAKYKIPQYVLSYSSLPQLASGKVDVVNLKKDAEKRVREILNTEA